SQPAPIPSLPRVDATVQLPSPYTPKDGNDYEMFSLPWTVTQDAYVTGFQVDPGPDVHHILIFAAGSSSGSKGLFQVGEYNIFGFSSLMPYIPQLIFKIIFGGGIAGLTSAASSDVSGGGSGLSLTNASLIGAFVPGIGAQIFNPDIGIKI